MKRILTVAVTVCLVAMAGSSALAAKELSAEEIYQLDPAPLTILQCAQCHPGQFGDLKQAGGAHQMHCQDCHEVIHAYNPLRNNYAEIMPRCSNCHDLVHGEKQTACLDCHNNPHSPRVIPVIGNLAAICVDCHGQQAGELKQFKSAHSEQSCDTCHSGEHGNIPGCAECHQGHFPAQEMTTCSACHPAHKPLEVAFDGSPQAQTCSGCHGDIYGKWVVNRSKHAKVDCTECHQAHGTIPECTECHTPPHGKKLLEMFPKCLTCHLDVHDMPVKKKK